MLVRALWGRAERWFVPVAPVGGPVFLTWPGVYDLGASSGSENATQMGPSDIYIMIIICQCLFEGSMQLDRLFISGLVHSGQQGSKGLGKPRALYIYIYMHA